MTMTRQQAAQRSAFTLIELMIVLVIVVMLMGILAPLVFSYQRRANINATRIQIEDFEKALGMLKSERGSFPTTEQGLKALLFIPLDEQLGSGYGGTGVGTGMGVGAGTSMGAGVVGAGGIGDPMAGGVGMTDPMMGGGMGTVPGAMPGMTDPMMGGGMGTVPGAMPGMTDPMMGGGMGTVPGAMPGMTDPMMGGGTGAAGVVGSGAGVGVSMMGAVTPGVVPTGVQPFPSPQLYTNAIERPDPLIKVKGDAPLDPFKQPYRYIYLNVSGINPITGEDKPAIWSAGPDTKDGTADDVCNWDVKEVQRRAMARQNTQQNTGGMTGGMNDPMGMGMPSMPTTPGMGMPGDTGMGIPGMPTTPGMGMPTTPGGMPTTPGMGMPTTPGGMPATPGMGMPTAPGGMPATPGMP